MSTTLPAQVLATEAALQVSGYRFGNQIHSSIEHGAETGDYSQFSQNMGTVAGIALSGTLGAEGPAEGPPASTPEGRLGEPMNVPRGTNPDTAIGGRDFGGHSIDQMQGRGVPPSAVENTIQTGIPSPDPIPGRIRYYDSGNNITVITEPNGKVVTVITGKR